MMGSKHKHVFLTKSLYRKFAKEILTINRTICELFFNIKMKCEETGIYAVTCEIIDI